MKEAARHLGVIGWGAVSGPYPIERRWVAVIERARARGRWAPLPGAPESGGKWRHTRFSFDHMQVIAVAERAGRDSARNPKAPSRPRRTAGGAGPAVQASGDDPDGTSSSISASESL